MRSSSRKQRYAFLNLPYDDRHEALYLAFIAGLCGFGLIPRATLELGSSKRRLDRILSLIQRCDYSFHDLSCVELDRGTPRTPRFNMPFELGLVVGRARSRHKWFVFEAVPHRLKKSLSDLDGTDPQIHDGSPEGVLRGLGNALSRSAIRPTPSQLKQIYADLEKGAAAVKRNRGGSLFEAGAFRDIVVLARELAGASIRPPTK